MHACDIGGTLRPLCTAQMRACMHVQTHSRTHARKHEECAPLSKAHHITPHQTTPTVTLSTTLAHKCVCVDTHRHAHATHLHTRTLCRYSVNPFSRASASRRGQDKRTKETEELLITPTRSRGRGASKGTRSYEAALKSSAVRYAQIDDLLDEPQMGQGKHQKVLRMASYMVTVVLYVKPDELKRDLNEVSAKIANQLSSSCPCLSCYVLPYLCAPLCPLSALSAHAAAHTGAPHKGYSRTLAGCITHTHHTIG
jgi:hypothetical protein